MTNKVKYQINEIDQKVRRVPRTVRAGSGREGLSKEEAHEFGLLTCLE